MPNSNDIRKDLGDFSSVVCFKAVITGVEDTLGPDGAAVVRGVLVFVDHLVGAIAHPPVQCTAQGIACGGYQHRRPEHGGVELDQAEHDRFGA